MMSFEIGRVWIFWLVIAVTFFPILAESADLVNVPIEHEVYLFINRLAAKGILPVGIQSSKPLPAYVDFLCTSQYNLRCSFCHRWQIKIESKFCPIFLPGVKTRLLFFLSDDIMNSN